MRFSLTARWVFPVSSPPIERGVVEIDAGRISAVHNRRDNTAVDLGNVAVLPGLVNAHTHLEFSDLPCPVEPPRPFTDWINALVAVRRTHPATRDVLQRGLAECVNHGTALVGEIATQDWPPGDYHHSGLSKVVFRELIGMSLERAAAQMDIARQWLDNSALDDPSLTRGLSPHAPYSVHPDLYRDLVKLAAERGVPVAIHLAETEAELEFLRDGTGEFVAMLQRFNAWNANAIPRGTRPLDYLLPLAALPRALVIHGNHLGSAEFDWLARHPQVSVVYCPRTHFFFNHVPHPWMKMLNRGTNVALGTDSRGSNPDLSLWREMQFLSRRFPSFDPATLLSMGTHAGAKALGQAAECGTLEQGKRADLTVVRLGTDGAGNPYDSLFAGQDAVRLGVIQQELGLADV